MKLSFHGAVRGVTGSCHKLDNLLFDCGMFQGEQLCGSKNMEPFGFDPASIEAVFITHPHADHTARLPKLFKEGFKGKVYMTRPCIGLTKLILEDSFKIMKEDAKKCGSSVLYELEDLEAVFEAVQPVAYHEQIQVGDASVMFHDAGHVLGSAFISVEKKGKRIIFSGDIGNDQVPILPDTEAISKADVIVCESTYGHRVHEAREMRTEQLKAAIEQTIKDSSVLMIPAFSIERTQELLYEIDGLLRNDLNTKIPIFLDSPMAIKATELYRHFKDHLQFDVPIGVSEDKDFFSFPNLHETLSVEESKHINDYPAPKIIIAGSGMMSGGRIMHHLIRYLPDSRNQLLIIGYQARGTVGRRIFEGAKQVHIFGEEVQVNAQVSAIGAFSAHADMNKLKTWLKPEDGNVPSKIFLTHGDPEAKEVFATDLRHTLKTDVIIPGFGEEFEI